MKQIIAIIILLVPQIVLAHSGHGAPELAHGFLHVEHLIIIVAIVIMLAVRGTFKK